MDIAVGRGLDNRISVTGTKMPNGHASTGLTSGFREDWGWEGGRESRGTKCMHAYPSGDDVSAVRLRRRLWVDVLTPTPDGVRLMIYAEQAHTKTPLGSVDCPVRAVSLRIPSAVCVLRFR